MEISFKKDLSFDFGSNWKNYSEKALSNSRISEARKDFLEFIGDENIREKSFLDIGFGQGLSLLLAAEQGANVFGIDINEKNKEVVLSNSKLFPELTIDVEKLYVGSILDDQLTRLLKSDNERFDIVHSWGVLHHTGSMWNAIEIAIELVKPNGKFYLAIYNKHWSSSMWKVIKWIYNLSPKLIRKIMIVSFYGIIFISKFLVTFKNPLNKERGMNFYYDIIDWVGGYPYEYASKAEIIDFMNTFGFELIRFKKAEVPTGCYEYVFIRKKQL
ncbi:MAG: class I SAM-dependent methyltransferase [Bacteroidales bacterium]|nr:class I SAM-dependent methyltransferase [Bacteroidales bacterium]